MAKKKSDSTGVDSFEEAAHVIETTSSHSRYSTIKPVEKTDDLQGQFYEEVRGEPKKGVDPLGNKE